MSLKKIFLAAAVFGSLFTVSHSALANDKSVDQEVLAPLKNYQQAVNDSDLQKVLQQYTDNAIVLPPNAQTVKGKEGVKSLYAGIFSTIKLNIAFNIEEVNKVSNDWALVRTTSQGKITLLADKKVIPEANHELFMMHKESNGAWKIYTYMFSEVH